jgi:parallel beta-helix repeat protein
MKTLRTLLKVEHYVAVACAVFITACLWGLAGSLPAFGANTTYYVDAVAGDDGNDGMSEGQAWETIAKVNAETFEAGDTILFKRGQTFTGSLVIEDSGTSGGRISIGAYSTGARPIITTLSSVAPPWTDAGGNIWTTTPAIIPVQLDGQKAVETTGQGDVNAQYEWFSDGSTTYLYSVGAPATYYPGGILAATDPYTLHLSNSEYITVQDVEIRGGTDAALFVEGSATAGNAIINNVTVNTTRADGIRILNSTDNTIQNSTISSGNGHGIDILSDGAASLSGDTFITGSTITQFGGAGVRIQGSAPEYRHTNNTLTGNVSFENGDGVILRYADSNTIEGNSLFDNAKRSSQATGGHGIGIYRGSANVITGNELYGNGQDVLGGGPSMPALYVWAGDGGSVDYPADYSENNTLARNRIHTNLDDGIAMISNYARSNKVIYNVIYDNDDDGVYQDASSSTTNEIYNTTFYQNTGNPLDYQAAAVPQVKNNLFVSNTGAAILFSHVNVSHNGFQNQTISWNSSNYTADQASSLDATFRSGAVTFTNPGNGDFAIDGAAVYIDAGTDVGETEDIAARTIQGAPDIGSNEYVTVGTPTPTLPPGVTPTDTPTPTQTPTPTHTPTPSPTLPPGVTPTETPTPTVTPTLPPGVTPSATPSPTTAPPTPTPTQRATAPYLYEGVAYYVFIPPNQTGRVPVFRFGSPRGLHFYTASEEERDAVIENYEGVWTYEGIAYYVYTAPGTGRTPVYRFRDESLGIHFYTASEEEKDNTIENYPERWIFEGVAYYVIIPPDVTGEMTAVYRFNARAYGAHFYTASEDEKVSVYGMASVPSAITSPESGSRSLLEKVRDRLRRMLDR